MDTALPGCCIACNIKLAESEFFIWVSYNPPEDCKYRYRKEYFEAIQTVFPNRNNSSCPVMLTSKKPTGKLLCVALSSSRKTLTFSKKNVLEQAVNFDTRGDSLLDIALHRNCLVKAERNRHVTKVYDCSDHGAVSLLVESPHVVAKPIIENFRSFDNADYTQINEMMTTKLFEATC